MLVETYLFRFSYALLKLKTVIIDLVLVQGFVALCLSIIGFFLANKCFLIQGPKLLDTRRPVDLGQWL